MININVAVHKSKLASQKFQFCQQSVLTHSLPCNYGYNKKENLLNRRDGNDYTVIPRQ